MKELVELIAKSLVDNPDKVQVSQLDGEQSAIIELKVAPDDMGKVVKRHVLLRAGSAYTLTSLAEKIFS